MGIHEAAHGLQTTKNPNPKRFFPDLGIHDPKGSSCKEHLDKNHPRPATPQHCSLATLQHRDHASPQPPTLRPFQVPRKTDLLEIARF